MQALFRIRVGLLRVSYINLSGVVYKYFRLYILFHLFLTAFDILLFDEGLYDLCGPVKLFLFS